MQKLLKERVEDDDDLEDAVSLWWQMMAQVVRFAEPKRGGSEPGKRANVDRAFSDAHRRYMLRYFWPADVARPGTTTYSPTQPDSSFERRLRMARAVFDRISKGVCAANP